MALALVAGTIVADGEEQFMGMGMMRGLVVVVLGLGALVAADQAVALPGGGEIQVPGDWVAEQAGRMRAAQFRVPGAGEATAEFTVYYFGADGAGGVDDNIARWLGQFAEAGRDHESATGDGTHGTWHLLQVTGTWNRPVGPPMAGRSEPVPDSAMVAAILPGPQGPYYLKLTGPEALVLAERAAVEAILGR